MNKNAFTLIEITISLLILAIGLVGILTLFPVGFDASGRAANITEATFLAQERIEDLKRVGYAGEAVTDALAAAQTGQCKDYYENNLNYDYEVRAYETGVVGLREVVVHVYWPHRDDADRTQQRNVELSTYLAQYEM